MCIHVYHEYYWRFVFHNITRFFPAAIECPFVFVRLSKFITSPVLCCRGSSVARRECSWNKNTETFHRWKKARIETKYKKKKKRKRRARFRAFFHASETEAEKSVAAPRLDRGGGFLSDKKKRKVSKENPRWPRWVRGKHWARKKQPPRARSGFSDGKFKIECELAVCRDPGGKPTKEARRAEIASRS